MFRDIKQGSLFVSAETVECQLLVFRAWATIVGIRMNGNASARGEDACDLDVSWIHETNEIFHDDIDTVFVEVAVIAETEEIEFQALAFDHLDIGDVANDDIGKVGLPGDRAEAGELGAVELDPIVVVLVLVDEGLEHLRSIVLFIHRLLVAKESESFFF